MRGGDVQSAISTVLAAARAMGASPDSFVYRLDFEKETSDLLFVCTGTVKTLYKDNAVAVVTNDDPLAITCFDLATKKKTMKVATTGKWLRQVSFAPDGSALLALSNANQLTAWEYPSGKQRWRLQVGDDPEWFHFFPDGKRVAVLVEDLGPTVAAVEDVIAIASLGGARGAWHAGRLAEAAVEGKGKSRMSPFLPFSSFSSLFFPVGISTSASPIATPDGRIYLASAGKSYVVQAGPKFTVLATNDLSDDSHASAAIADGRLFLKGRRMLYCIAQAE